MDLLAVRCNGEYLSDVNIAKILALDKVTTFQRKIISLVKCRRNEYSVCSHDLRLLNLLEMQLTVCIPAQDYSTRHVKRATPPFYSLKAIFYNFVTCSIYYQIIKFIYPEKANGFALKFHSSEF